MFWIPALLCATDLNWVNITCGAPVGPSVCVHIWVCACVWTCVWTLQTMIMCFLTTDINTYKEEASAVCPKWIQMVSKQLWIRFFSIRNYCLSSPIKSEDALSANYLSLLPCSLLEKAAGGSVKGPCLWVCKSTQTLPVFVWGMCIRGVFVHSVCLAMAYCSATVRRGLPCWSFQINRHW